MSERRRSRVRTSVPLQILYPALEVGDQFISAVDLPDHLSYAGMGIGKLPLQFMFVRHRNFLLANG
jgi:hypothetical protein